MSKKTAIATSNGIAIATIVENIYYSLFFSDSVRFRIGLHIDQTYRKTNSLFGKPHKSQPLCL